MYPVPNGDPASGASGPQTSGQDEDAELARNAAGGDSEAFGQLFDRWFDRVFDVAWHILHSREQAADVAQDTFVAAWTGIADLRELGSFGGWLLRIARNKALNRLRREQRSRPVGAEDDLVTLDPRPSDDPTDRYDSDESGALVWAASAALGEEDASLLHLHLRHELDAQELAEELGVKPNAAHQRLFRLKQRLAEAIGAWVLWRGGDPECVELQAVLQGASVPRFDRATAKLIGTHTRDCSTCVGRRDLHLRPEALFAATPLVIAEPMLRAEVVAALTQQDVPVSSEPASASDSGQADTGDGGGEEQAEASPSEPADSGGYGDSGDATSGGEGGRRGSTRRSILQGTVVVAILAAVSVIAVGMLADPLGDGTETSAGSTADRVFDRGPLGSTTVATSTTSVPATTTSSEAPTTTDPAPGQDGPEDENVDDAPPQADPNAGGTPGEVITPPPSTAGGGQTTAPAEPPSIVRFTTRSVTSPDCLRQTLAEFVWASEGATSATLAAEDGTVTSVPPTGSAQHCAAPGSTWTLTVEGPGGSDSQPITTPSEPQRTP
jgi:RNA polymerase sigma factor (sigma-70 family)